MIVLVATVVFFLHEPGCALVLVALVALICVWIWFFVIKVPQDEQARRESAVTVSLRYDTLLCGDKKRQYPLWVQVRNGSDQQVRKVEWTVEVTEPGHSTNLATGWRRDEIDTILQPGQQTSGCWALPDGVAGRRDAGNLVYEVGTKGVGF